METTLTLSEGEKNVLLQVLQGDLSRLLLEIAHTDHRSMRDALRTREEILKGVIDRLG